MNEPLDKELDEILEAAAGWHARLDLGTADVKAFERWRDADPRHAAAFARMVGTDAAIERHRDEIPGEIDPEFDVPPRRHDRRQWLFGAGAAVVAVAIGGGAFLGVSNRRAHAETTVGGRADLAMPDGGNVNLNTDSRVSWHYDRQVRDIWVERGEVSLNLPADDRPLRIHANGQVIVGVAGKLNIRLRDRTVEITLLDGPGLVVMREKFQTYGKLALAAGQSVDAGEHGGAIRRLDGEGLHAVTAWQSDEMIFTGQTLSTVVNEYNRYLTHKIVIRDPSIAGLRLGGRFNVHDVAAFLSALKSAFGVQSAEQGDTIVLTR